MTKLTRILNLTVLFLAAGLFMWKATPVQGQVTNPGFEVDGAGAQTITGWSESGGHPTASFTSSSVPPHGGEKYLGHWLDVPYNVFTYQTRTGLPNGNYTLKAWVQRTNAPNGQTQTTAQMEASGFGGATKTVAIPVRSTWTQISITGINVINGTCTFGFRSDSPAKANIRVDDVEFAQQTTVPTPWAQTDVGPASPAGSGGGDGSSFSSTANPGGFHYIYQPLSGNCIIKARVASLVNPSEPWAKAGVMIRETLLVGSKQAAMIVSRSNGLRFEYTTSTGGTHTSDGGGSNPGAAPYWVKLVKNGTSFKGYKSLDGINWGPTTSDPQGTPVGSTTISMNTVYVGLPVVTNTPGTSSTTATFDNVTISADMAAPGVPTNLAATAISSSQINLSWTASTDTGGSGLAGYRIYRNGSTTPLASVAAGTINYSNTGLAASTAYTYRVTAYDQAGNESALSAQAGTTTWAGGGGGTFDYYISPTGNNNNPGTQSQPWAITALQTQPIGGKRIGLLDGTYRLSGPADQSTFIVVAVNASGTAGQHTVIEAVNPRQAVITTNNGSGGYQNQVIAPIGVNAGVQYVTFRGIRVTNCAAIGIWIRGSHVLIENCQIDDCLGSRIPYFTGSNPGDNLDGIATGGDGTNLTVRNCLIDTVYNPAQNDNSCGVGSYNYSNIKVENTTIKNTGSATSLKRHIGGITITNSFFYNVRGWCRGFLQTDPLHSTARHVIHHNVFVLNHGGSINSEDIQRPVDVDMYNNTIVWRVAISNNDTPILFEQGASSNLNFTTTNRFYNNIYTATGWGTNGSVYLLKNNTANIGFAGRMQVNDYNCYNSVMHVQNLGNFYGTRSAFRLAFPQFDAGSIESNPLFANLNGSTAADFKLQAGSPCKDAGRVGGVSSGSFVDMGGWAGVSSLGCDF